MSVITKDLGVATAYGYAKSKGYTGTEEEFAQLMASYADVAQQAEASAQDAEGAKDAAITAKTAAQTAQTAAESAQTAAAGSAQTASTKASEASNSATAAAGSATAAGDSATAAAGSAETAQTAAQTATTKASEASSSASAASAAKTGAETARTGAQTAQTAAETAQANAEAAASSVSASAAQIEQNTEDITGLKNDFAQLETDISILKTFHNISTMTLAQIHDIVQSGAASRWFNYGDQIELTCNDGTNDYTLPWDVVAFGNFELQNSDIKPGMVIQSHYVMQGVQFDASEAIYIAESAMPAGTYHFTIGTNWGTHCIAGKSYQFTTAQEIPAGGQILVGRLDQIYTWGAPDYAPSTWRVHTFASNSATTPLETNLELTEGTGGTDIGTVASSTKYGTSGANNLQRAAYGYNRWSQSANRQFYNSNAAAGAWWTPQNPYDRAPEQLASVPGFMKGFDEEFLNIIKPVKVTTALNTVSDTDLGTSESTYDTFFLPSLEQEYIAPQLAGVEGDYWPYWKERLGLASPQAQGAAGTNPRHIRYAYNAKTSAQNCRLRSANRGSAHDAWFVSPTGTAYSSVAAFVLRGCPACVII